MATTSSKDGRFEILVHKSDNDSYMYSNTRYNYVVVVVETGDFLWLFSGHWNQDSEGSSKGGVKDLSFSQDSKILIIEDHDGTTEERELPVKVKIAKRGNAIKITWPDGNEEVKPRQQASFCPRHGPPYAANKLKDISPLMKVKKKLKK